MYAVQAKRFKLTVFFHNFQNYDAHFIMQHARERHGKMTMLATTREKIISLTIGNLIFKDSFQMLSKSLASLASNLPKEHFLETRRFLSNQIKIRQTRLHIIRCDDEIEDFSDQPEFDMNVEMPDEVESGDEWGGDEGEDEEDVDSVRVEEFPFLPNQTLNLAPALSLSVQV